ncbi:pyridoxamine 5'-phosphate oxidase family protein [Streptomyces sp. S1A]|uniref:Pyridoxamine 5'-phosphate oxidase family protein n=1 Tax=Streptomyces chitinivorans TaxID=1257027 RepID=A0ABW7HWP1_9ACTN|nr:MULTISPECIES: pyridoxamine 5'-phosphate oxidase family protein [Streptomyces]MCG3043227.1 pyridoxamine 5'-phosphate oxidase family protein [Streptomyces sp. ICN903]MDH2408713.1 pyridoxamine 5'-phosphate oxidase family protein [Streptomyces chitinivorans]
MHRHDGFRELDRRECLNLLGQVPLGRIVYTENALPAVLPVNFFLDRDQAVVLRTSGTSRMARAVDGSVVAFEVDRFDEATRSGWSVVVTGRASLVTDPGEAERLGRSGPLSWAPVEDGVHVRIGAELVTGRLLEDVSPAGTV